MTERRELRVDGMSCASCAASVARVLRAQPGVRDATVDFMLGRALVDADAAADLGTVIHALIETEMKGGKADLSKVAPDFKDKAENAILAFWEWRDAYRLEATGSEVPLVSDA